VVLYESSSYEECSVQRLPCSHQERLVASCGYLGGQYNWKSFDPLDTAGGDPPLIGGAGLAVKERGV